MHVVDLLEIIEIDHAECDCQAPGTRTRAQDFGRCLHAAAVEAAGERIGFGQFTSQFLGSAAFADLLLQLVIAAPAENDQDDIEKQRVDQQVIGGFSAREHRIDSRGQNRRAGSDEQDDRGCRDAQRDEIALCAADAILLLVSCHLDVPAQTGGSSTSKTRHDGYFCSYAGRS